MKLFDCVAVDTARQTCVRNNECNLFLPKKFFKHHELKIAMNDTKLTKVIYTVNNLTFPFLELLKSHRIQQTSVRKF